LLIITTKFSAAGVATFIKSKGYFQF